ncbi:MAG: BrnT family toxin [Proteobacteria bacterium]|nr:BrnT family toxin [Pseudomonadota bacterium]
MLLFEWDPEKAITNKKIHGITFDEASTVFKDTLSVTIYDPLHSEDENRFVLIGNSHRNRLLVVVHTERGNRVRIISTRKAKKKERQQYEENAKRSGHAGRI